jgi:ABC-2 type transport system permease protein
VVVPVAKAPASLQPVLELLPSAALAESLRVATIDGAVDWSLIGVLVVWGVAGVFAVGRWFRWD